MIINYDRKHLQYRPVFSTYLGQTVQLILPVSVTNKFFFSSLMFRRNKLAHLSLASIFRQVNPFYNGHHPDGIFRLCTNALAYFIQSVSVLQPDGKLAQSCLEILEKAQTLQLILFRASVTNKFFYVITHVQVQ